MAVPMKLVGLGLLGIGLFVMIVDSDYKKKVANEPQDPFFGKNGSKALLEMGDANEWNKNFSWTLPGQGAVNAASGGLLNIKAQDDAREAARLAKEKVDKEKATEKAKQARLKKIREEWEWLCHESQEAPNTGRAGLTPQPRPNSAPGNTARGGVGSFAPLTTSVTGYPRRTPQPLPVRTRLTRAAYQTMYPPQYAATSGGLGFQLHPNFPIGAATVRPATRPAHLSRATGGTAGRSGFYRQNAKPAVRLAQRQPHMPGRPAPVGTLGSTRSAPRNDF